MTAKERRETARAQKDYLRCVDLMDMVDNTLDMLVIHGWPVASESLADLRFLWQRIGIHLDWCEEHQTYPVAKGGDS